MESEQTIHDRMLSNIGEEHDKLDGSFIFDATEVAAIEFAEQQKEIKEVEDKLDVENLMDDELTRFVYQRTGVERKLATHATTTVVISGTTGSIVSAGDLVATDTHNFVALEDDVVSDSGFVNILVECEEYGAIGNVPANSINRFPVSIPGLIDVYNPEQIKNGYEEEPDDELLQRYYDRLQRPGKAGNKYHYEEWAKEVVGVGVVKVVPRFNGPLTVKVIIVDSNRRPAGSDLVDEVGEHIKSKMPFGVDELLVVSAIGMPINITVSLMLAAGYDELTVIDTIKENIAEYLKEIAFRTTFVSYARIGSAIIDSDGVLDYTDLLVNGVITNVPISDEEVAIVGGVNE